MLHKSFTDVKVILKRTCGVLGLLLILPISPIILVILGLLKVSQGS